ncbi:hypothetical protein [Streptomyces clavuligerus]|uniref:hypothetical protein n=1 Tax=Streptomyces clavuligerus TaxID=1901 RepID=UPI00020D94C4|nr:hypothetical protein [Streptomyces clavuligerus]ANW18864.1 hypothetical protein BB341_11800 [Streptomyces clavuligerus]AXU13436.1 hypothetical protein D1794_12210 [Streptomyces clavuligerus]MBY6303396.1 hypothetical protein [Streptomyces clavuligerus]QCS06219.1 hypothetical protein CRV15_11640 [Streptomyces clavuligerus]QPJ94425.1 hypothetical protein GE265_16325 [Streptomyces clavuligerus]
MNARRWYGSRWYGGRVLVGVAAAVVLSTTATACGDGGSDSKDDIATGERTKPGEGSGDGPAKNPGNALDQYIEKKRGWVTCLRTNGIEAPDPDAKGQVDLASISDGADLKRDPKYTRALEKCADLNPPVPVDVEKAQQPKLSKAEIAKRTRYATCMQENGAADFPDVDEDGYSADVVWDSTTPEAKRAIRTCGSIIGSPDEATVQPQG